MSVHSCRQLRLTADALRGRLSSGAAAQLAGVPKPMFLAKLAEYGVPTFGATELEPAHDVANA